MSQEWEWLQAKSDATNISVMKNDWVEVYEDGSRFDPKYLIPLSKEELGEESVWGLFLAKLRSLMVIGVDSI